MSVFVGIDVHRRRSQVALLDEGGATICNRNVVNAGPDLAALLDRVPAGSPVAFEAGYGWSWLVELLDEHRLQPHLVHPTRCRAIASARLKNDRVDAVILAQLLRADLLPEAWIATPPVRELRTLLRHRAQLVRTRTRAKNRIQALLAEHGLDRPEGVWSGPGREWLRAVSLPPVPRLVAADNCQIIDGVEGLIRAVDQQIAARAKTDPRTEVLMRLPGVGRLTALMLLAEIGPIDRFTSARKLTAFAGLTPVVRNSDRRVRHGHISKQGSPWLRWVLTEAAQRAKRDPAFAASFAAIARRRGRNIATTAIARKLLTRVWHLLTDYENQPAEPPGRRRDDTPPQSPVGHVPADGAGKVTTTGRARTSC